MASQELEHPDGRVELSDHGEIAASPLFNAAQPWELLADSRRYIDGWLIGYSGALGSIAGVLIVDYWIIRKTRLSLRDLYLPGGAYHYPNGWNLAAVLATLLGAAIALLGAFWPPFAIIYDFAWFIGFFLSGALYWMLMRASPQPWPPAPQPR